MAKNDEMPAFYGGGYKLTDEVSSEEIPDLLYSLLNLNYFSASSIEHWTTQLCTAQLHIDLQTALIAIKISRHFYYRGRRSNVMAYIWRRKERKLGDIFRLRQTSFQSSVICILQEINRKIFGYFPTDISQPVHTTHSECYILYVDIDIYMIYNIWYISFSLTHKDSFCNLWVKWRNQKVYF